MDYDDAASCATLRSFRLVCPDCNLVTHRGMAGNIGLADQADADMIGVNGITLGEARQLHGVAEPDGTVPKVVPESLASRQCRT